MRETPPETINFNMKINRATANNNNNNKTRVRK